MTWKPALISLIFCSIFMLYSCDSDDETNNEFPSPQASIVGTWDLFFYEFEGYSLYDADQCDDQQTYIFQESDSCTVIRYKDDENQEDCEIDQEDEFTYFIQYENLVIQEGLYFSTYFYSIENDTLTLQYSNVGVLEKVKKLVRRQ